MRAQLKQTLLYWASANLSRILGIVSGSGMLQASRLWEGVQVEDSIAFEDTVCRFVSFTHVVMSGEGFALSFRTGTWSVASPKGFSFF